jgi:hypothetical protein
MRKCGTKTEERELKLGIFERLTCLSRYKKSREYSEGETAR